MYMKTKKLVQRCNEHRYGGPEKNCRRMTVTDVQASLENFKLHVNLGVTPIKQSNI